jgi:plasmid stabilization system protein ParE
MARVQKTSRAEGDLTAIVDYIAADNLDAALRWSDEIDQTFRLLAHNPLLGEEVSHLLPKVRRQAFGNYLALSKTIIR